jgi:hypothetical protein
MILSGKQLEALEILAERYDRGEIDDRQFIRMKQELLNPVKEKAPIQAAETKGFPPSTTAASPPPPPRAAAVYSSTDEPREFGPRRSSPTPQTEGNDSSAVRRQKEAALVFHGSNSQKNLRSSEDIDDTRAQFLPTEHSSPKTPITPAEKQINYFEPPVSVPKVEDYERPSSSWLVSGFLPTIFTLFLSCALIYWITQGNIIGFEPPNDNIIDEANETYSLTQARRPIISIRPLFGPLAVSECISKCIERGSATDICQTACGRRSLSVYARQIAEKDRSSKVDAKEIQRRCSVAPSNIPVVQTKEEWVRTTSAALASIAANPQRFQLSDARSAKERYNVFVKNRNNLRRLAPGDSKSKRVTNQILETTCLGAHISLVELGMLLAQQNNDVISRRYYYDLFKKLGPTVIEVERRLIQNAADMNLVEIKKGG